ncbi:MAG: triphosphoribosyl-dephospho-CoA synthase CitG [Synergistaceae bacterium]|nr:triphosphoribosyl-dephospho-CoA synthase CitG [Synergistaceae bacterium]
MTKMKTGAIKASRNEEVGSRNEKTKLPNSAFRIPHSALIGTLALEAMLVEVSVTPKPGLVDRNNSGAHSDMSFFTFLKSAAALRDSFEEFARAGENFRGDDVRELFPIIRKIGIEAEKKMFTATDGINTHKGEIFSLGLLSAAASLTASRNEEVGSRNENNLLTPNSSFLTPHCISQTAAKICAGICEKDFAGVHEKDKKFLTKGERVFIEHGITGIRGEAESGYPVVIKTALPALKKYLSQGFNINDALAFTLIHIMAEANDTNIISRKDFKTAEKVRKRAADLIFENKLTLEEIYKFDNDLISEYISPGGAGDLLAVTYFLFSLQESARNQEPA